MAPPEELVLDVDEVPLLVEPVELDELLVEPVELVELLVEPVELDELLVVDPVDDEFVLDGVDVEDEFEDDPDEDEPPPQEISKNVQEANIMALSILITLRSKNDGTIIKQ